VLGPASIDRSRRGFLALVAAAPLVVACSSTSEEAVDGSTPDADTTTTTAASSLSLVALFDANGSTLRAGAPQRLPYALGNRDGMLLRRTPDGIEVTITSDGNELGPPVHAAKRGGELATPYYSVSFTPPVAGAYELATTLEGERVQTLLTVPDDQEALAPQVGDLLPPVHTATFDDARGVETLCSREPPCPYHDLDLFDAVASDHPTLLLIASPGYCKSGLCPPMLDILVDEADALRPFDVIHAEVYTDPVENESLVGADQAEVVTRYGLRFEPVLFVVDPEGRVTARLDGIFDRHELEEYLAPLH
jgi:hypothetical protein